MGDRGEDDDHNQYCNSNSPCFRFGFGDETIVDEYIWRVANVLGDNNEYHLRILCELQRNIRHGYTPIDEPLLPHEHFLRVLRQPEQQGDRWHEYGRVMVAEPTEK